MLSVDRWKTRTYFFLHKLSKIKVRQVSWLLAMCACDWQITACQTFLRFYTHARTQRVILWSRWRKRNCLLSLHFSLLYMSKKEIIEEHNLTSLPQTIVYTRKEWEKELILIWLYLTNLKTVHTDMFHGTRLITGDNLSAAGQHSFHFSTAKYNTHLMTWTYGYTKSCSYLSLHKNTQL